MKDDLKLKLRFDELTENPTARVPVCLVLDASGSMAANRKMDELNRGVREFFQAIKDDEMAAYAAEIAIVTFDSEAKQIMDFANVERQIVPTLNPSGYTVMGKGVNLALQLLDNTKRIYSQMGVDYYQPWLVLMTDGEPQGETDEDTNSAMRRCQELVGQRKLTVFPIAIGDDANLNVLAKFSPNLPPLRVDATDFKRFFSWLAKSINAVSLSNPGDSQSISIGENEYKKMNASFHTQMKPRR